MAKKGASDGGAEVAAARSDEQARQENIRSGTKKISDLFDGQFNDQFYDGRRDSFVNYASPQLADQHKDASKQLTFALERRGALDSSSRASLGSELEKRRATLKPAKTPGWAMRGYAHLFHETILQADEGCDFDFMRENGKG